MNGIQEFLFGPPTSGSNDPDISKFLANQEASRSNQRKNSSNLQDGPVALPSYGDEMESPSMQGLLKYNYATADATGVAHDNIDGILAENKARTLANNIRQSGSIGPTPFTQTKDGQEALLELAMGNAMPGSAVGRVSKAAITGGQKMLPKAGQKIIDLFNKIGREPVKGSSPHGWRGWNHKAYENHGKYNQIGWNNKVNAARLAREKAYNKYGLPHQRGNPSYPVEPLPLMDSVSELLHAMRFRKN